LQQAIIYWTSLFPFDFAHTAAATMFPRTVWRAILEHLSQLRILLKKSFKLSVSERRSQWLSIWHVFFFFLVVPWLEENNSATVCSSGVPFIALHHSVCSISNRRWYNAVLSLFGFHSKSNFSFSRFPIDENPEGILVQKLSCHVYTLPISTVIKKQFLANYPHREGIDKAPTAILCSFPPIQRRQMESWQFWHKKTI